MIGKETKERLERKYGIKIHAEEWWHPLRGRFCMTYRIYSADGNRWAAGLTYRGLQRELREWGKALKEIAAGEGLITK